MSVKGGQRWEGLGHLLTDGSNDVAENVVLGALLGQGLGEADHGQLCGRVVCLAEAAEEAGGRGSVDDAAKLLLAKMGPGGAGALVGALDVNIDDEVPVGVLDVLEADVAKDAGVIEEDVDAPKGLDGGVDDAMAVFDAVVVGGSLATGGFDLIDDDVRGLESRSVCRIGRTSRSAHLVGVALALEGAAEVVDDDAGTARGEEEGVGLAEAAASAGDDDDLAVESQLLSHYLCGGGGGGEWEARRSELWGHADLLETSQTGRG